MKTSIEELVDFIRPQIEAYPMLLFNLMNKAKESKAKHRTEIIEAYNDGMEQGFKLNAEAYYENQYQNK